jgi:hypothetical protein
MEVFRTSTVLYNSILFGIVNSTARKDGRYIGSTDGRSRLYNGDKPGVLSRVS